MSKESSKEETMVKGQAIKLVGPESYKGNTRESYMRNTMTIKRRAHGYRKWKERPTGVLV